MIRSPVPGAFPRASLGIGPATGVDPVQPVTEFDSGQVKLSLSSGPEMSFSMPGRSTAALLTDGLATDVWLYRRGVLAERFRVLSPQQEWDGDGADKIGVTAVGYRRLVEARHIITGPPVYLGVDQGAILWDLVTHTQTQPGGSLGITSTPANFTTGVLRDRTEYLVGDNLGQRMSEMGAVENGAWWGVDQYRVFSARLWDAFPTHPSPVVLGMNARKLVRTPGTGFANVAGAIGSTEQTVPHWIVHATATTDPRGRWEAFDSQASSVILQATVVEHAAGLLAERLHPPNHWTCDIDPAAFFEGGSDYDPGDFVTIHVPRSAVSEIGIPPVSVRAQVTEISIPFDGDGAIAVNIAAVEVA